MSRENVDELMRWGYDLHIEPLEIRSNGDRVFVWVRFTGHGADSGVAMEMELAHVLTLDEDGKTRRLEEYFDRHEALKAVGLSEQGGENPEPRA
jgi:ketosteroid isomerase-like protein